MLEADAGQPVDEEPSVKRALSSSATCTVAFLLLSVSTTCRLFIYHELLWVEVADVQFAETEGELRIYSEARSGIARRKYCLNWV